MKKIKNVIKSKRFYVIIILIITDLILGDLHYLFQDSSHIPPGYGHLKHPMQAYVFDFTMYIIYVLFAIIVLLFVPKKDLVLLLVSIANLIWWGNELLDFLLFNNEGLLNTKDYLILLGFVLAIIYGVKTYRRKKGDTEEIVNVTNIALLKMLIPNKEMITVNSLIEEKEKVDNEYQNLLYHLQHQIKQPFTSLEGLIQLEDSEMKQQLMYKCLHDVKSYLHELTNLDYISNQYKLNSQPVNFRKVFNDVKERILNSNKVHIHYYENKTDGFKTDDMLLSIILEKLLQNAINFSKESFQKPNVYVYIYRNDQANLVVEVKDEGIGMEEENKDKIFNMFYKGSLKSTGVGLGLYIVKKTVEKLNGEIVVLSRLGFGSSFKIIIPDNKEINIPPAKNNQATA